MKKILLTAALAAVAVTVFAQGKVQVQNDGTRLVTIVGGAPLPSGVSLVLGLYAGTSSTSLSLVSAYPVNPAGGNPGSIVAGQIASSHCILPFPGGSTDYFMVKVWDGAYPSWEASRSYLSYGQSIFTMTPGTGIAYPGINNGGGTTLGG